MSKNKKYKSKYRSFDELSKIVKKDDLNNYYNLENHSLIETMEYFNLSEIELDYLLHGYELTGIKKTIYSSNKNFEKIMQRVTYDEVYNYFIVECHTINESAAYFNLTRATFRRLLAKYNIKKSLELAAKTQKRWILDTFGVENSFQRQDVKDKITQTFVKKYGVEHALQNKDFLNKAIDTSISRYGENFRIQTSNNSGPNKLFASKLDALGIKYEREFRLDTKFFDFKIGNYLVEINPTITHNINWSPYTQEHIAKIDENYHINKRQLGIQNGYKVLSIFDWINIDKVINLFFKQKQQIYARNCDIKIIEKKDFAKFHLKDFINTYHIQGWPRCGQEYAVCLFYNNKLIAAQTWGRARYNKNYYYELYRQVTDSAYIVVGGNERMFAHFQKQINTESKNIISYCDYNLFSGKTYDMLGFKLKAVPKSSIHWVYIGNVIKEMTEHQKHFTDNEIRQHGFDRLLGNIFGYYGKGTSNKELLLNFGYVEVCDCGQATYIWQK